MKLISMTDYITSLQNGNVTEEIEIQLSTMDLMIVGQEKYSRVVRYKDFLKKPLELGMIDWFIGINEDDFLYAYQGKMTIEGLQRFWNHRDITLTQSAIKQLKR